jgi:hypothetical protein
MLGVLTIVARLSPAPYPTDQLMMERVGRGVLVPGCADLNCFRILVPAAVEALPGDAMVRWRAYAVIANALAAIAAARLALELGLSSSAATWTAWLSALGAGSLATVYHPYNADSFVLLLAPLITILLLRKRWFGAGALSTLGIFAKEFAAAPLYIASVAAGLAGRWRDCARQGLLAIAVTGIWVALQVTLIFALDYSYNDNPSSNLMAGGYLRRWLSHVTPASGAFALLGAFGGVYLLLPFGWRYAPDELKRLALGAVPALAALAYVATPERALWNFFFLVLPMAAMVLERAPVTVAVIFVASHAVANLRVGAQIAGVPHARYALALSLVAAATAIVYRRRDVPLTP